MRTHFWLTAATGVFVLTLASLSTAVPCGTNNIDLPLQLYSSKDKILSFTQDNFAEAQQNRSTLVEFYTMDCDLCDLLVPRFKKLAKQLYPWRDALAIGAINCGGNFGLCNSLNVTDFPTLRYFRAGYVYNATDIGQAIKTINVNELRAHLALLLAAENRTENYPNLRYLTEGESKDLFANADSRVKYVVLVYEPENSTFGIQTVLHFQRWPDVLVRRIADLEIAKRFQIDGGHYKIATVGRSGAILTYGVPADTAQGYAQSVENYLDALESTVDSGAYSFEKDIQAWMSRPRSVKI